MVTIFIILSLCCLDRVFRGLVWNYFLVVQVSINYRFRGRESSVLMQGFLKRILGFWII